MSAPRDPVPRLPHAAPFLLLDRVVDVDERSGTFLKCVSAADPCVGPDGTLPPLFVLEALAQAGGALVAAREGSTAGMLAAVEDFRLHGEVRAGDEMTVEVHVVRSIGGAVVLRGRALVGGTVRAEGRFTLAHQR